MAKQLFEQGIEVFCPLVKEQRQWSDRLKAIETPLLKSCLFVRIDEEQRTPVRLTEGVINFVYRSGKPVVIKEKQIQQIRQFQLEHPHIFVIENSGGPVGGPAAAGNGKAKSGTLWIDTLNLLLVAGNGLPQP